MTHIPPPLGSGHPTYPQHAQHANYPDPNASGPPPSNNPSPGTPSNSNGLPSPSFLPPSHPGQPQSSSSGHVQGQSTDRNTTSSAASALLSSFPPYSHLSHRITSLKHELDSLNARQRIWKRLAHAAVLFSSDHELRYSLLDKCNDLAECIKNPSSGGKRAEQEKTAGEKLKEEVAKMNEVELQLFSISSTAKQLLQDAEWVRAEDIRGFVEGVRQMGGMVRVEGPGGETQMVQVRLERGRGDVGRRLNYLMVTSGQNASGQTQGGGGGGGQGQGQGEGMMGEGGSRRSSTAAGARGGRGQQQPQSQVQSYLAAQAVAAAATASSRSQSLSQSQPQQEETGHGWSPANASAASSAGRASPGPSEGSSTGPGHGPNRARWWDTVITDSDTDQRRRSESSRLPIRGAGRGGDNGSDCEMEM